MRVVVRAGGAVLVLVVIAAVLFQSYRTARHREYSVETEGGTAAVEVLALLREVDVAKGEVRMRLFVSRNDDQSADQAFEIESNSETSNSVLKLPAGATSASADATVSFEDGDDLMYPFDRYRAAIDLRAYPLDDGVRGEPIPTSLSVESLNAGFQFAVSQVPGSDDREREVSVALKRAAVPKVMAIVMSAVMAALAVIVVSVGHLIVTGRRKFEFASFTWMAAMLFALVGFRNAAPGTPAMGSLFDFMGFFWAELAVAVSLIRVGAFYIGRQPNPPHGQVA